MAALALVLMTAPSEEVAAEIGKKLVAERLAACANLIPHIRSLYAYKGTFCDEAETLCIVKTRPELFAALERRVRELHPYEVPEVVMVEARDVAAAYLAWVLESTDPA
jgi:periplasmic divalent cation tolerance protein